MWFGRDADYFKFHNHVSNSNATSKMLWLIVCLMKLQCMYFTLVLHFGTFITFDEKIIKSGKTTNLAEQHVY